MMANLSYFVNWVVKKTIVLCLPLKARFLLGRYLLDQARNDNNDDPAANGEYYFLEKLLERKSVGQIIFDVGANVGEWSLKASRFLGRDSSVYAFEPVKETFGALSRNVSADVKIFNLALGNENGESIIFTTKSFAGTNSLVFNDYVGHTGKSEKIVSRTGDSFCAEHGIRNIFLVKIDTEGFELNVLGGFAQMLDAGRIDFVQFEYGGAWIYSRSLLRDAFVFFHKNKYQIGKIHPEFIEIFNQYDPRSENYSYSNWIAIRPGVDAPMKTIVHVGGARVLWQGAGSDGIAAG